MRCGFILGRPEENTSQLTFPGGVYSQKNLVGVCSPLPKTLTLFMTKTP